MWKYSDSQTILFNQRNQETKSFKLKVRHTVWLIDCFYMKIFWFNKLSFKPRKQRNQEFDVERYRRKLIAFFIAFKSNDTYHYSSWGNLYNLIFKNFIFAVVVFMYIVRHFENIWFAGRKLILGCHVKSSTMYASSVGKSLKSPARYKRRIGPLKSKNDHICSVTKLYILFLMGLLIGPIVLL